MKVTLSSYTIAEYVSQMDQGRIVVNREYQRSDRVWPPAAQSYLIDTILRGFPMPKVALYQHTDVKNRTTMHEIVDGQQRSETIRRFYKDQFRIGGPSEYAGRTLSGLDPDDQTALLEYSVTCDVFVGATPENIREMFRRMNSYMIPLNNQEKRHASFQGKYKWFMVEMSSRYAELLKQMGVLGERQLVRMADSELVTEVVMALTQGITTARKTAIDGFYRSHEESFAAHEIEPVLVRAFDTLIEWPEIHNTALMKPYNFYALFAAICHALAPSQALQQAYSRPGAIVFDRATALANLTALSDAIDSPPSDMSLRRFQSFIRACSEATNTASNR